MKFLKQSVCSLLLLVSGFTLAQTEELNALALELAELQAEIQMLEAENEIENLQKIFGFYIDEKMWTQAADLFTDDGTIEMGGSGVYESKARVLAYLKSLGNEGAEQGVLNDHMQLQPVIHVMGDGTAKARWHHFSQEAVHGVSHHWGTGIYENEYRFEDGVWKISKLHLYSTMRTPYDNGWAKIALSRTSPSETLPPDQGPSVHYENYPAVYVVPFHYENPVTGDNSIDVEVQPLDSDQTVITDTLNDLEKRVGILKDEDDIERLHVAYGYYLARNQWDELTGIFARDGTIEIAQRGIYVGQEGVRRNLNLYGVQGELPGQLHNHMQYQPVIHVNEDGMSGNMRSRAFSMMGAYEGFGTWMGGVYENTFIKEDGVWKINTDQVFNTYFASYNQGWKELNRTNAPGLNDANPPDLPPSVYFEMYPSPYVVPFHYSNPVTGQ